MSTMTGEVILLDEGLQILTYSLKLDIIETFQYYYNLKYFTKQLMKKIYIIYSSNVKCSP